jgi:hypothetical protein
MLKPIFFCLIKNFILSGQNRWYDFFILKILFFIQLRG